MRKTWFASMAFCTLACLTPEAAWAQEQDQGLDEIIVTAQKRSENLQEVPLTITAFSSEQLDQLTFDDISGVADFSPNVIIDTTSPFSGASSSLVAFIRGIGQTDFTINFDPGVGLYVDGVYYARNIGAVIDLLDVERIEVLKGPQGTLFGRNTIGGALSITTQIPTDEVAAAAEVTFGSFNRIDVRGSVSGPLSEDLRVALSFSTKNRDGFQERIPFPGPGAADTVNLLTFANSTSRNDLDQSDVSNANLRLKAIWEPTARSTVTFVGDYSRVREAAPAATLVNTFSSGNPAAPNFLDIFNACLVGGFTPEICSPNNALLPPQSQPFPFPAFFGVNVDADPTNDRTPFDDRFIPADSDTSFATGPAFSDIDNFGVSVAGEFALSDSIDSKIILAYRNVQAFIGTDIDGSPLTFNEPTFDVNSEQFTSELQFTGASFSDRLEWLLGLYYFRESGTDNTLANFGTGLTQFVGATPTVNQSGAVFGQATYDFTEKFSLTFGARFTREVKRIDPVIQDLNAVTLGINAFLLNFIGAVDTLDLSGPEIVELTNSVLAPAGIATPFPVPGDPTLQFPLGEASLDFNDFSPRVALDYQLNDDLLLFFNYARGFKSGGFDQRPTTPQPDLSTFDEEVANSLEGGFKASLFQDRVRFNGTGFFIFYQDVQQQVQVGISPFIENAAAARIAGGEWEVQALLLEGLTFTGTAGFLDADFVSVEPNAVVTVDSRLQNTARWTGSIAVDYAFPVTETIEGFAHVDWAYTGDVFNNPENTPELFQEAHSIVNLSVGASAGRWRLKAGATNLTDRRIIDSGFFQPGIGFTTATFNRPREWFASISYQY